jgi:hypothetical protein
MADENTPFWQRPVTPPVPSFMDQFMSTSQPAAAPTPSMPFSPVSDPAVRSYLEQLGDIGKGGSFQWNNPYKFTGWGVGLDPATGFGGKLGSFLGNNAPLIGAGFNMLTGGLQAYTGLKGLSAAQDALKQQKKEFNINLTNQTQAYNTEVGDRIAGRQYNSEAERAAALAAAQLTDRSKYGKGG